MNFVCPLKDPKLHVLERLNGRNYMTSSCYLPFKEVLWLRFKELLQQFLLFTEDSLVKNL